MCKQETQQSLKRDQSGPEGLFFDPAVLGLALGEIISTESLCSGIAYVAARSNANFPDLGVEYYIVSKDSPALSATAKAYGKKVPGHPGLLSYLYEDKHSGRFIVEYEAYRYMTNHNIPLPAGETLRESAIFGAELNPEYFGTYPVPLITPWGYTLRNKVVGNGVYWLEAEEGGWVLAVHFPLTNELTEETRRMGKYTAYDQEHDKQQISCLFFDWECSCLALFELIEFYSEWETFINKAALKNAICLHHPNYVETYNQKTLQFISYTNGAGTEFFQFE